MFENIQKVFRVNQLGQFLHVFFNDSKMVLPILAGSLSAFAFVFTNPLLLALGYCVFILSLVNKPVRVADRVGLFFGFSQFLIGLFWFFKIEDPYLANSHLILQAFGLLAMFLMSMLFAFFAISITLVPVCKRNNAAWFVLVVPSSLALMEWVKTIYFTGFPWFQASHVFTGGLFKGWYAIFGEIGVSLIFYIFVSMFCGVVISSNKKKEVKRYLLLLFLFFALTLVVGDIDYSVLQVKGEVSHSGINVLLIHGNSTVEEKESYAARIQRVLRYQEKVLLKEDVNISIWPESASGTGVYQDISKEISAGFSQIEKKNTRVFFGGYVQEGLFVKNSIFSSAQNEEIYTKQHLAPIGEYIPMWFTMFDVWIPGAYQGAIVTDALGDLHADNLLVNADTMMTPIICYEVLFNEELRRRSKDSGILAVFSDLEAVEYVWVKNYFFNLSRIRAMETQKPVLVSSNKGISGVITKKGVVTKKKQGNEGEILTKIWPSKAITPFSYFGNSLILTVLALMLLVGLSLLIYPILKRG